MNATFSFNFFTLKLGVYINSLSYEEILPNHNDYEIICGFLKKLEKWSSEHNPTKEQFKEVFDSFRVFAMKQYSMDFDDILFYVSKYGFTSMILKYNIVSSEQASEVAL